MFLSKTFRIFLISVVVIVSFFVYPQTSSALRIDHLEQHAGGHIINCKENTTIFGFGQSSCFEDKSSKKSESVTLIQKNEPSNQNADKNRISPEKSNTEDIIKIDKIKSLPVGVVGSLAVIGGLTPIYFVAKRLLQNKEIKALKERINVLETIVTKE
jgi:hypothetical protein